MESAIAATGSKRWMRSKLMAVGEGGAGKTVTFASLQGKPFVEEHESTCGAAITSVEVRRGTELDRVDLKRWRLWKRLASEHDTFSAEIFAQIESLVRDTATSPHDLSVVARLLELRQQLGTDWVELKQMGLAVPCIGYAKTQQAAAAG